MARAASLHPRDADGSPRPCAAGASYDLARLTERLDKLERRLLPIADQWPAVERQSDLLWRRRCKTTFGPFTIISQPEYGRRLRPVARHARRRRGDQRRARVPYHRLAESHGRSWVEPTEHANR
jgi:hypothetical protein